MNVIIQNKIKGKSIINASGLGSASIALQYLTPSSQFETIHDFSIKRIIWSTNGNIIVSRNSEVILSLYNSGDMKFNEIKYLLNHNSDHPLDISIENFGNIIFEVNKSSSVNVDADIIYKLNKLIVNDYPITINSEYLYMIEYI